MDALDKDELTELLVRVDTETFLSIGELQPHAHMVIVGGSAFILSDLTRRPVTCDVDVFAVDSAIAGIVAEYTAFNGSVAAYADEIPYNFEERLVKLDMRTKCVDYFTPCLEDLAVMKLYAWRPNDISDLTSPAVLESIDWDLLSRLVHDDDEARASALFERRYREMVSTYEDYERRWK